MIASFGSRCFLLLVRGLYGIVPNTWMGDTLVAARVRRDEKAAALAMSGRSFSTRWSTFQPGGDQDGGVRGVTEPRGNLEVMRSLFGSFLREEVGAVAVGLPFPNCAARWFCPASRETLAPPSSCTKHLLGEQSFGSVCLCFLIRACMCGMMPQHRTECFLDVWDVGHASSEVFFLKGGQTCC